MPSSSTAGSKRRYNGDKDDDNYDKDNDKGNNKGTEEEGQSAMQDDRGGFSNIGLDLDSDDDRLFVTDANPNALAR